MKKTIETDDMTVAGLERYLLVLRQEGARDDDIVKPISPANNVGGGFYPGSRPGMLRMTIPISVMGVRVGRS